MRAISALLVATLASFPMHAQSIQTKTPADWCKSERGYFIAQEFIKRPILYTREQIFAALQAGQNEWAKRMMETNMHANDPIENAVRSRNDPN
jgi:hypothetical protein